MLSTFQETKEGDVHINLLIINTNRNKEFTLIKEYLLKNENKAQKYSNFKREISKDEIKSYCLIKKKKKLELSQF